MLARGHANGHGNGILDGGGKNPVRASEADVGICRRTVTENTDLRIEAGTVVRLPEDDAPCHQMRRASRVTTGNIPEKGLLLMRIVLRSRLIAEDHGINLMFLVPGLSGNAA